MVVCLLLFVQRIAVKQGEKLVETLWLYFHMKKDALNIYLSWFGEMLQNVDLVKLFHVVF